MNDEVVANVCTLYGTPHSLYTGKIRSYLIKKKLPFRELLPPHARFRGHIRATVRLKVAPVIEMADGLVLQDTTDMIEHFERVFPGSPMIPAAPVQRAVAWLIGAFGSEALLPVAMSYRWSYRAEQENFLRAEFGRGVHSGPDRAQRLAAGLKLMDYFNDFLPGLGVTAESREVIEDAYLELIEVLDIHLQHHPYILGGRPSIADFGLMAPLYAHLARDPVPATLMKNKAPNLYRWTERMNLATIVDGEFPDVPESYLPDDVIPQTLEPLLRLIFQDWGPELEANANVYNGWASSTPTRSAGDLVALDSNRVVHPTIGPVAYAFRGRTIRRASAPHDLWHFDKAAAYARALCGDAAARFSELVERNGGERMMAIRLSRPMARKDYVLVLA